MVQKEKIFHNLFKSFIKEGQTDAPLNSTIGEKTDGASVLTGEPMGGGYGFRKIHIGRYDDMKIYLWKERKLT